MRGLLTLATLLLAAASPAAAQDGLPDAPWANRQLPDPAAEARARTLMESLRCLVCQGQSIADSDAAMAADMRSLVRERVAGGEPPEAVRDWLVARYGRYVSYDPPLDAATAPLWLAPILLIAAGILVARGSFRKSGRG